MLQSEIAVISKEYVDEHRVIIDITNVDIRWIDKTVFDLITSIVDVEFNVYSFYSFNWENILSRRVIRKNDR